MNPQPLDRAAGEALLAFYDRHRRDLPWRAAGAADPYRVWLSEVMLQQTTVAAVVPYFERFTLRWPTVEALAAAHDEEVMAAWAGLGYYARARNLLACARTVAAAGFPRTREGLRALPGVGAYTSAAVAAIAFGEPVAAVDGNVERVVARLLRLEVPPKRAGATVAKAVEAMMVAERAGDFAQAMMELGATVCTPKSPACGLCPMRPWCAAAAEGDWAAFPVRPAKTARASWGGAAFVPVRSDGAILTRRRPPHGLLGGMNEAFGSPWTPHDDPALDGTHAPFAAAWVAAGAISHGFTHAELTLRVYRADGAEMDHAPTPPGGRWLLPREAGLPTLMAKVVDRALALADHAKPAESVGGRRVGRTR